MEPPQPAAPTGGRAEAERLLAVAAKLLGNRDLTGSREFAVLAQEAEPLLDGSDQILAICDVLLASDKPPPRPPTTATGASQNNRHDWYTILQIDRRGSDLDVIKRNYRRLALLLHPDKNRYPLADSAFRLVSEAWSVLSDPGKRSAFDSELTRFVPVDLTPNPPPKQPAPAQPRPREREQAGVDDNPRFQSKLPVRRSSRGSTATTGQASRGGGGFAVPSNASRFGSGVSRRSGGGGGGGPNFWTACPYCYVLYEYPRVYEECCLRCQSCERAFHAASVPSLPPFVPGKEAYYCCWGFFPLGFTLAVSEEEPGGGAAESFPNWVPPMFGGGSGSAGVDIAAAAAAGPRGPAAVADDEPTRVTVAIPMPGNESAVGMAGVRTTAPKKRGRPRKRPL